jgi:hypothetical protein
MTKYFTCTYPNLNVYKKPNVKSEIVTELIYGESFSINLKNKNWYKVKIKEDNYQGYIRKRKFKKYIKPTHKISELRVKVFSSQNKSKKIRELSFNSKIRVEQINSKFARFDGGWVEKKNIKPISTKNKNYFEKVRIFKNVKYKWGGKSFKGIDCSGLVQIFLNYNNVNCPRDAKDQVKFFKKNISFSKIKKNDLIFWKGHVAIVLSKKKLIHAYGPFKKTVIMNNNKTIKRIKKTANLKIIAIKRVR